MDRQAEQAPNDVVRLSKPPTHEAVVRVLHAFRMDAQAEATRDPQAEHENEACDFEGQVANDERDEPKGSPAAGKEEVRDRSREQQNRRNGDEG